VKLLKDLFGFTKARGFQASGAFSHGEVEVAVVNSLGVEAYQPYSDLFLHLIAEDGRSSGYCRFRGKGCRPIEY